jgi:1,4-dihydroxy-2-naphthoate octaprenyltransferase
VGALATAILVVNNLRDRFTDARVGKRTLAVRFGARGARLEYAFLLVIAYGAVGYAVLTRQGGEGWLLALASLPIAWRETRAVWRKDGAALNAHLGGAARLELVFGVLLSLGALLW